MGGRPWMLVFLLFLRFDGLVSLLVVSGSLKMDLTEGSETSAKLNLTPWRHPKEHIQNIKLNMVLET
jgi:hypothetical protein